MDMLHTAKAWLMDRWSERTSWDGGLIVGVKESTQHRVRKFGYGDGYEQIAPDGINSRIRDYNIKTRPLTDIEANSNLKSGGAFLGLRPALDLVCRGDFFVATLDPLNTAEARYRVVDNKYDVEYIPAADKYIFTFELREAFSGNID